MKKIILASTSPRRSQLLKQAGIEFSAVSPDCDENIDISEPEAYVRELSSRKCLSAAELTVDDCIVIGSDTIVVYDGKILGKPKDEKDAFSILKSLSGNVHSVYTGVTVMDTADKKVISFYDKTDVEFYPVSDTEILDYIKTGEPMDKAGAYGIQGIGVFLVKAISGDYNNVVGLPVAHLIQVLKEIDKKYECN